MFDSVSVLYTDRVTWIFIRFILRGEVSHLEESHKDYFCRQDCSFKGQEYVSVAVNRAVVLAPLERSEYLFHKLVLKFHAEIPVRQSVSYERCPYYCVCK